MKNVVCLYNVNLSLCDFKKSIGFYRSLSVNERINLKTNFARYERPEHLLSRFYLVAMRQFAIHNPWGKNRKLSYQCLQLN